MAGIIDTIKLASTLVLAIPAALAGLEFLLVRGETTAGAMLLVLAAGLVALQHWVPTPGDVPELLAKRALGTVVKEPESDPDAEPDDDR
ncbi:DUF7533 family protein [Halopiger xanaduensis]|uniref:Uncharacterized protein n=1 Tax=Halopiger xanaduensis (strain DSM 18323 / JCM 14033 / SH-6) TaxID=797210 RepID=F8D748_HALXS|nr:hypothetical protein [Halopiger xanaduensis]AEH36612.1 hypothetical protein Halxa_1987 [Halopiger xanaduensis SH-6]